MDADSASGSSVTLTLSYDEAVILHEALAYGEWSGEFEQIDFLDPLYVEMLSRLQLALARLIPELGSEDYGPLVKAALAAVRPSAP